MNPLELVAKTLYSFQEKELTFQLLDAFGKRAKFFQEYEQIAKCFFEFKNFPKAIEYGEKTLKKAQTREEKYVTGKNLVATYNQLNLPEKAIEQIEKCKKINSNDFELLFEESFAWSALNQKEKSHKILHDLLNENLTYELKEKVLHNLSGYYFLQNDIHNGLKHFLIGGEKQAYKNSKIPKYEKWDGTITSGRTIIIDNQCGAGDEVVHIRFMKYLQNLGMNPIWNSTRKDLVEFFKYNQFNSVCSENDPIFPEDSCWVFGLALPYYLNLDINDLGKKPYLKTIPEYDQKWNWIKEKYSKKRVGVFWKSSSGYEQNLFRTTNLNDYMEILKNKDCDIFSLQVEDDNIDYGDWENLIVTLYNDRNFIDTFSIIQHMDLVVTSCSFTAHAAASIGKEVCIFVPIMDYYVWISKNKKTHWYGDHVHLFYQQEPRCWKKPMEEFRRFIDETL